MQHRPTPSQDNLTSQYNNVPDKAQIPQGKKQQQNLKIGVCLNTADQHRLPKINPQIHHRHQLTPNHNPNPNLLLIDRKFKN